MKKNIIAIKLEEYRIEFNESSGSYKISSDFDFRTLSCKKIIKMLGLKNDKGHLVLIEKLNTIQPIWLNIFLKTCGHYDVYNDDKVIDMSNFYLLLDDILDGLE
ncbi:hypothetical protein ACRASX_08825 [Flavobacterium sp. TMP13]|uniref:hypothetical protein n=1 Tax=Flavobacterium sp. TMP13 TaxID=3425950 RepID=UPI003D781AD6